MKQHKSTTHEERYIHLRGEPLTGPRGEPLPPAQVAGYFICSYLSNKYKAMTIFARCEEGYEGHGWYMSIALCSMHDQFSRASGRQVARRKYFKAKPGAFIRNAPNIFLGIDFNFERAIDFALRQLMAFENDHP